MITLIAAVLALAQPAANAAPGAGAQADVRAQAAAEWARIQPQLDARRPLLEAYVQVAAGWRANGNCRVRPARRAPR
jgi:hypothetical protein